MHALYLLSCHPVHIFCLLPSWTLSNLIPPLLHSHLPFSTTFSALYNLPSSSLCKIFYCLFSFSHFYISSPTIYKRISSTTHESSFFFLFIFRYLVRYLSSFLRVFFIYHVNLLSPSRSDTHSIICLPLSSIELPSPFLRVHLAPLSSCASSHSFPVCSVVKTAATRRHDGEKGDGGAPRTGAVLLHAFFRVDRCRGTRL